MKIERKPGESVSISNCNFELKVWDGKAIETVNDVAKALLNLTELFKSQNVTLEAMVKFEASPKDDTKE